MAGKEAQAKDVLRYRADEHGFQITAQVHLPLLNDPACFLSGFNRLQTAEACSLYSEMRLVKWPTTTILTECARKCGKKIAAAFIA